jgi:hypothetical protein
MDRERRESADLEIGAGAEAHVGAVHVGVSSS